MRKQLALVYGSVAKGSATASSDIALLLVSDTLTLDEVFRWRASAESTLGREMNPTLYTSDEFSRRLRNHNSFLARVLAEPVLLLKGALLRGQ